MEALTGAFRRLVAIEVLCVGAHEAPLPFVHGAALVARKTKPGGSAAGRKFQDRIHLPHRPGDGNGKCVIIRHPRPSRPGGLAFGGRGPIPGMVPPPVEQGAQHRAQRGALVGQQVFRARRAKAPGAHRTRRPAHHPPPFPRSLAFRPSLRAGPIGARSIRSPADATNTTPPARRRRRPRSAPPSGLRRIMESLCP